jgi:hypothetical protein
MGIVKKSTGLGDSVEKVAKFIGADKLSKTYEKITGKPCGCSKRKNTLNRVFPYKK